MSSPAKIKSLAPAFCVSLLPKNERELKTQLSGCRDADLIEIRLDWLKGLDLNVIKSYKDKPLIASVRTRDEGGFFSGSLSELIKIYRQAIDSRVDYIDISYSNAAVVIPQLKFNQVSKIILSAHTQKRDIRLLSRQMQEMSEVEADLYKLVFSAEELNDNSTALDLIDYASKLNIPFIIHTQGEQGKLSRIMGSFRGNAWTFVSLSEGRKTAPGQLSLYEATQQFYLKEKTPDTRILGLLGFPLQQSRGWLLFNRLFHLHREVNAIYLNFPTRDLEEFWAGWESRIEGLSVTIPHKEGVLKFIDDKSREVKLSGVCNTLVKSGEFWKAHNTDFLAMVELLKPHRERLASCLVYGTGATARSAISALKQLRIQKIFLMGRNKKRGEYLADRFSITFLDKEAHALNPSAIIQTTPVGMYPSADDMPPCAAFVKEGMLIFDVVHNPPVTKFLQFARQKGCATISGAEMFLHQAARQFELFTGKLISVHHIKEIGNELS